LIEIISYWYDINSANLTKFQMIFPGSKDTKIETFELKSTDPVKLLSVTIDSSLSLLLSFNKDICKKVSNNSYPIVISRIRSYLNHLNGL